MESLPSQTTWLQRISNRLRFRPTVIGSDFQPLGTHWSSAGKCSITSNRKSFGYATFHKDGQVHVLIAGGICTKTGEFRNDVYELIPQCPMPSLLSSASSWSPRHNFSFVSSVDGKSVLLLGGEDHSVKADVWLSSDYGTTFHLQTSEAPWAGRTDFACVLANDRLIIAGGRIPGRSGAGRLLNDVWLSSDKGKSWSFTASSAPWKPFAYGSLTHNRGDLILLGGLTDVGVSDQVWTSPDLGRTWILISIKPTPWKARRAAHTICDRLSGEILIFGGVNNEGAALTDSWATTDGGKSWMPREHVPCLAASTPVASVCEMGEVVVLGMNGGVQTVSDLKYIRRDCRTMLMIGNHMNEYFPDDIWLALVIPFTVDTRALSKRVKVPW